MESVHSVQVDIIIIVDKAYVLNLIQYVEIVIQILVHAPVVIRDTY